MDIPIIKASRAIEIQTGPHAGQTHQFEEPVQKLVGIPMPEWNFGAGIWVAIYRVSPLGGRAELDDVILEEVENPASPGSAPAGTTNDRKESIVW